MPDMVKLAIALGLLLIPIVARAEIHRCVDRAGNVKYSDRPCEPAPMESLPQSKSFQANLLITRSHSEIEQWVKLDPAKRQGNVGRLRTVKRDEKLYVPIVATFAESQVGQPIQLSADFELLGPNGRSDKVAACCMANQVDPRAPSTIVLNPVIDITFDAGDANGEYTVIVRLTNGREVATAREKLQLR
jgi:hypothetical protein